MIRLRRQVGHAMMAERAGARLVESFSPSPFMRRQATDRAPAKAIDAAEQLCYIYGGLGFSGCARAFTGGRIGHARKSNSACQDTTADQDRKIHGGDSGKHGTSKVRRNAALLVPFLLAEKCKPFSLHKRAN